MSIAKVARLGREHDEARRKSHRTLRNLRAAFLEENAKGQVPTAELIRAAGVSQTTAYRWLSKEAAGE